ncbi:hypothetical protein WG936_05525 [Corynebacterium sp. H127]|uniref:hypothetical protein n=1 Tax=Corynebacterium sp. H127 TaxID=3133418 RepID=UPI0030986FCB
MVPDRAVPKDTATVKTLQGMTESSAKQIMRQPIDNAWGQAKVSFLDIIVMIIKNIVSALRNGLRGIVGLPPVGGELDAPKPPPELEPSFQDLAQAMDEDYKPALTQIEELRKAIDLKASLQHTHTIADVTGLQAALDDAGAPQDLSQYVPKTDFEVLLRRVEELEQRA